MRLKKIENQVVVIVGATSGIGRQAALQFAASGARLVAAGRSGEALQILVEEITRQGGTAMAVQADVSQPQDMRDLADQAIRAFGRIDTWVHVAAVTMYARFEETQPEEFSQVVNVNLLGQVYGAMAALPYLRQNDGGALIHVSSVESFQPLPYQSAYAASKHGLKGYLDTLRLELEHDHIPVAVSHVIPASVDTPLFDKALTRLGAKPAPVPPIFSPQVVADAILYAAEHPTRTLYAGGSGQTLNLLQRYFPALTTTLLGRAAFKMQKSDEYKPESSPNNLFQHLPGHNTIHGSFHRRARKFSPYTWLRTHRAASLALAAAGAVAIAAGAGFVTLQTLARRKILMAMLAVYRALR